MFYSELNFVIRKKGGSNFVKDRWANVRNEMGIEMQLKQNSNMFATGQPLSSQDRRGTRHKW
jgi:hypothetical protein